MIGVKWYGGCLEVCQRPSNEEKLGASFGDNRGNPKVNVKARRKVDSLISAIVWKQS